MSSIRIASYNLENLFRRAKILALQDSDRIRDVLDKYAKLSGLLAKANYTAADKSKIVNLYAEIKTYVAPNMYMGRLFNRAKTQVVASGRDDWFGAIDLKKQNYSEVARKNTAKVIKSVDADILCVVEAEDRIALDRFSKDLLKSNSRFKKYAFNILIDGNDRRGIDVALYSRFPIRNVRTNIFDDRGGKSVFSRDCLEVQVDAGLDKPIHVLVNHLKSKGYGRPADNDRRRKEQSSAIAKILRERYSLNSDYVVVAGDLNDTPASDPLSPVTGMNHIHDALDLQFGSDMDSRWTYTYRGALNQIDYLLLSTPLKNKFVESGVERRGIYYVNRASSGSESRFSSITRPTEQASDHGAVWADFDF